MILVAPLAGRARGGRAFKHEAVSHCSISQMTVTTARIVPTLITAAHTNGATKLGTRRPPLPSPWTLFATRCQAAFKIRHSQ
jgi:hypothetical protein